jgi:hypothetical protein
MHAQLKTPSGLSPNNKASLILINLQYKKEAHEDSSNGHPNVLVIASN